MIVAAIVNAHLVERLGMRRLSHAATIAFATSNLIFASLALIGFLPFWLVMVVQIIATFCLGLILPNYTALSLEPLGDAAGIGSSVQGFLSATPGAALGGLIGATYDGTATGLAIGYALMGLGALGVVYWAEGGRLLSVGPGRATPSPTTDADHSADKP